MYFRVFVSDEQGKWLAQLTMAAVPREAEQVAFVHPGTGVRRIFQVIRVVWTMDEPKVNAETTLLQVTLVVRSLDAEVPSPYRSTAERTSVGPWPSVHVR